MKYIEISDLEDLSRFLTDQEIGNAVVNGKIECYSTNSPSHRVVTSTIPTHESSRHHDVTAGSHNLISDLPTSTLDILAPRRARAFSCDVTFGQKNSRKRSSSLGDLNEPSTRQLLFDLISTLNESNPDYDFHCSNVENFIEKDVFVAMRTINNSLAELTQKDSHLLEKIWRNIDVAINLRRCEVFSYTPESEEDAFGDNFLWSLNYFFYNKENARICYLCISAARYCLKVPIMIFSFFN